MITNPRKGVAAITVLLAGTAAAVAIVLGVERASVDGKGEGAALKPQGSDASFATAEFRGNDEEYRDFIIMRAAMRVMGAEGGGEGATDNFSELEALTAVRYANGGTTARGKRIATAGVIVHGVLRNAGSREVFLRPAPSGDAIVLNPGETLVVAAPLGKGCQISCPPGAFSCCNANHGHAQCTCEPDGSADHCQSGGSGASACSAERE